MSTCPECLCGPDPECKHLRCPYSNEPVEWLNESRRGPRWAYKTVEAVDLQGDRMNRLGAEGWELVAINKELEGTGGARDLYVFKRRMD